MSVDLNSVKLNLIKAKNEVKQFYKKYDNDIKKLDNKPFSQIIFINQLLKDIKELKQKNKLLENEIENLKKLNKKNTPTKIFFNIGQIWS